MIEKGIRYKERKEQPTGQMAKTTKEELMYYLSPVYGKDAIKDLDEDQLKELLDELTETFYKVKKKQGGVIKDPTFTKYFSDGGSADDEKPKPKDNEFVYDQRITFQPDCLDSIFEYIESISNVRIEWMDKDEFVDKNMTGIRITHD